MKKLHVWGARAAKSGPTISTRRPARAEARHSGKTINRQFFGACSLLLAALIAVPAPARADVTAKDVQVMARALGFTEKPPTGEVNIAIVFAPGNPQSAKEATDLQAMLGSGLKAGNLTLKPVMVKIDELGSAGDVAAFLLTEGVGADAAKVGEATKAKQKPCLTVDMAQVQSGACVMGIKSEPKVEIVVNKASAAASGISFGAAFRMMITEL
jgi:hypothetical protein